MVQGKVAFVTGAGSGIGRAVALMLSVEGAAGVVCVDIDGATAAAVAGEVDDAGAVGLPVRCDVTDDDEVGAAVDAAVARFGRLDCCINNAGTSGAWAPIAEHPLEEWHRTIAVNLTSVFLCMRREVPALLAGGGGAIVNSSSGAGLVASPGQAPYVASKHGVLGLTKTASREYAGQGIRVNAVCPGTIRTPMLDGYIDANPEMERMLAKVSPLKRLGEAAEVAAAMVWLCSDAASFVHGHSLVVDGGALGR
jgi:NAD(P)-dependent dehydrogenase (short-subunit alcohol dehydrogenase family)